MDRTGEASKAYACGRFSLHAAGEFVLVLHFMALLTAGLAGIFSKGQRECPFWHGFITDPTSLVRLLPAKVFGVFHI